MISICQYKIKTACTQTKTYMSETLSTRVNQYEHLRQDVPALAHWERVARDNPSLTETAANNEHHLQLNLERGVLSGNDPEHAKEAYLSFGAYNSMEGADSLLAATAATLYEANKADQAENHADKISLLPSEVIAQIDTTEQPPSENLFYAGCAVLEAARIQEDPQEKTILENYAHESFNRIVSSDFSWEEVVKWQSAQQLRSLQSERILNRLRTLEESNGEDANKKAQRFREGYIHLRSRQIQDFQQMEQAGVPTGFLGEMFTEIVFARDQYESGTEMEREMVASTPRQDKPHDGLYREGLPRQAFDEVLRVYNHGRYQSNFIQIKTAPNEGEYDQDRITVVDVSDYLADDRVRRAMRTAVDSMYGSWQRDMHNIARTGSTYHRFFTKDSSYEQLCQKLSTYGLIES